MHIDIKNSLKSRDKADLLVIPFWSDQKGKGSNGDRKKGDEKKIVKPSLDLGTLQEIMTAPLSSGDFLAKEGDLLIHYLEGQPEPRVCLLGLGKQGEVNAEKLRKVFAKVTKRCHQLKILNINVALPEISGIEKIELIEAILDGLLLPNYHFNALKKVSKDLLQPLEKITLIGATKADLVVAEKCSAIAESIDMVRDLVNGNADDITPQYLAAVAEGLQKTCKHVKAQCFDKKRIKKEGMGLLLAVNQGSHVDPAFIIVEYKGNPKSKEMTAIVGKGITFDTGGLNLKGTGHMEDMKCDMAGAAVSLGVIHAAATLGLKVNVTAIIPSTENSISSQSYKPGDVYTGYTGKSVEIGNTDAEGRLALADAIGFAIDKLKPTRVIDLATLTGSVVAALGHDICGIYSNDDALAHTLLEVGQTTGEWLCRLPLHEDYRELLKSDVADIKSTGGRNAGSITAALFLKEFVGGTPWAHLDIAGTAYVPEAKRYFPKYATGFGVRLLVKFLETLC